METTLKKALSIFDLFKSLNGLNKAVTVGGKETVITTPYQFDSKTIWNISKNLNILKRHAEDYETATKMLMIQMDIDPKSKDVTEEKAKEFNEKAEKMLDEKVTVNGLLKIKLSGLNLDKNSISPGIIADLSEWIDEE